MQNPTLANNHKFSPGLDGVSSPDSCICEHYVCTFIFLEAETLSRKSHKGKIGIWPPQVMCSQLIESISAAVAHRKMKTEAFFQHEKKTFKII
jgi:hypothetical protein